MPPKKAAKKPEPKAEPPKVVKPVEPKVEEPTGHQYQGHSHPNP